MKKRPATMKELKERRLDLSKSLVMTLQDFEHLKEIKEWVEYNWGLLNGWRAEFEKLRLTASAMNKDRIFREWWNQNRMSTIGFPVLKKLEAKIKGRRCSYCDTFFIPKNRYDTKYCSDSCRVANYQKKRASTLQTIN